MKRFWIGLILWGVAMSTAASAGAASTYTVDIGGAFDTFLLGKGWYAVEGPYDQFGPIWRSVCRWAAQGSTVKLPAFPNVTNTIEVRCDIGTTQGQKLRCYINGKESAEFTPDPGLQYKFDLPADMLQGKDWAELRFETNERAVEASSDTRDLRMVVDWIKITAEAPERNYLGELILEYLGGLDELKPDQSPTQWRMRYDPNNAGNTHAPHWFSDLTHDDSAFDLVPTSHVPEMRRGDACWYRAWMMANDKKKVSRTLKLPGNGFTPSGTRQVWVNGALIEDNGEGKFTDAVANELKTGPNLIVAKLMKSPLPRVSGDNIIEKPTFTGEWTPDSVAFSPGTLTLTPEYDSIKQLEVTLTNPGGKSTYSSLVDTLDLGNGRRGYTYQDKWPLTDFGEYSFTIEDNQGHSQRFPVHFLGVHFFHWGWYIASGGTTWNGFQPCSNDYIDQLFDRMGDWNSPHHSICWVGGIFAPGTGFHKTEKVNYIEKFKEAFDSGQMEFVGMPYQPRNISCDFGESLLRSMRYSRALYDSQLGQHPTRFYSHDAVLTPQLPQIMRLCGYDTYTISENWWGQGHSIPNSRDCYWKTPDGSSVRVLDSWYHGISPYEAAHRAVEQGKPAVLCNEEFACLDATVFLTKDQLGSLASEGIFLKPITLAHYQQVTEDFAREYTYQGDDALCYKGWTGGGPAEVEYEKINKILENRLVALENMAAFARYLGIEVDQKAIDAMWDQSLRDNECHLHWGNFGAEQMPLLQSIMDQTHAEMTRIATEISKKTTARPGITVLNPLGFTRQGLVQLDTPENATLLVSGKKSFPLQADPDTPGKSLASLPGLPSCGYRSYGISENAAKQQDIKVNISHTSAVLDNGLIRVTITPTGEIASIIDTATGKTLVTDANKLYFARRQDKAPDEPLSTASNRLNLNHYTSPITLSDPKLICQGPVISTIECNIAVRGYPTCIMNVRITLAADERQARVKLSYNFPQQTTVCPAGAPLPHEGCYIPGIFVSFPMPRDAKPMTDMAYCITENALPSTNHETFMTMPFRNGTFNALSFAGPNTGEYAVLTRGLPDFFVVPGEKSYLGLSLGVGHQGTPHHGSYVHEYTILTSEPGKQKQMGATAYKAAQSFLVDAVAVSHDAGAGLLPAEASFAGVSGESVIIPGVELLNGELKLRVLNLQTKPVNTQVKCLVPLGGASVAPDGSLVNGVLRLGAQGVRELSAKTE